MTPDDILFAILGLGFATSIAYVGSELLGRRASRVLDRDRLVRQQQLWTTKTTSSAEDVEELKGKRNFDAQPCCGRAN